MSRKKLVITAIILACVLVIGGILAYFTDVVTKTNTFKLGKVDIDVEEDFEPDPELLPGMEFVKAPRVVNKGSLPVYAFIEVSVPFNTVKVGDAASASATELFDILKITRAADETQGITEQTATGFNSGWVSLNLTGSTASTDYPGVYYTRVYDKKTVEGQEVDDTTKGKDVYVFAYVDGENKLKELAGKALK